MTELQHQKFLELKHDKREFAINQLGKVCLLCGNDELPKYCYHIHHVIPSNKKFVFSKSGKRKWKEILEELKKCVLLCANCHAKVHHSDEYNKQLFLRIEEEKEWKTFIDSEEI